MAIRTKLALWYSLLVAVILISLGGIRYAGQKRMLLEQKDFSLKVVADILDVSIPNRPLSRESVQSAVARVVRDYPDIELKGTLIEIHDPSRHMIYSSSLLEGERLPVTPSMWAKAVRRQSSLATIPTGPDLTPIRVLTRPVFERGRMVFLIQVGRSLQDVDNVLDTFVMVNLVFIPFAALLVGAGGWLLTRRALKPLDAVIEAAHRIRSGDWRHRIEVVQSGEEIRELGQAFNQMIERLEASFRQVREFSENVSHELRMPLAILKGETELSLRRIRSGEDYQKVLQSNLEEVGRMEKIVERLLFLSRADRGEIELNLAPVDLSVLAARIVDRFQSAAEEKGVRLNLSSKGPAVQVADEILLGEVFSNLLQNALNHTPAGGEIRIDLKAEEPTLSLSVSDTGCGILGEDLPRIFERFYQVDRSRASQGSGLGLSLCQWIVRAHQGRIEVQTAPGEGSRFTVVLPLKN